MACGLLIVGLWLSATLPAHGLGILIPAYFDPGSHSADWDRLALAAQRVPLVAIMNPNNGPSTSAKAAYSRAITQLRNAGGGVIGYVYSSYTTRPLSELYADIDRYNSYYSIDGFFIDEMTNDTSPLHLAYYEELYRFIKARHPAARVVGNPGTATASIYLDRPAADALVTFESNAGYITYRPDVWTQTRPATAFSHLCYAVASASAMTNYVQLAQARNAAYIYVTDDAGNNPWDRLPSYWEAEVALIEQLNRQAALAAPARLAITIKEKQSVQISVSGAPGRYLLQSSSNFQSWRSILTNVSASGSFSVPAPAPRPRENYRTEQ
jgi:hypothetical protein